MTVLSLGVLGTSYYFATQNQFFNSSLGITQERMAILKVAIRKYLDTTGRVPATFEELLASSDLTVPSCDIVNEAKAPNYQNLVGWCGPYLKIEFYSNDQASFKTDGWGTLFQNDFQLLRSCGPDKTCNNGDDIIEYF